MLYFDPDIRRNDVSTFQQKYTCLLAVLDERRVAFIALCDWLMLLTSYTALSTYI